jgi:predicted naringenin-chalcone synthase
VSRGVFIHSIGTAVPAHVIGQEAQLAKILTALPEDDRLKAFVKRIYANSGIAKRHSVLREAAPGLRMDEFIPADGREFDGPTTGERNAVFDAESGRLSAEALADAFGRVPGFRPESATHLITVSCTGFSAPGFWLSLVRRFALSPSIGRFHLGFMGCFGAFPAFRLARALCLSERGAKVLIVCCELCSLHYRHRFDPQTIIANSLFADGAAAALVSMDRKDGNGSGLSMSSFLSEIFPGTEGEMGWNIGDHGFEMTLSKSVPGLIGRNLGRLVSRAASLAGIRENRIGHWAIHPGGRAILDGAAEAMDLSQAALAESYSVLAGYGNMSSASILFVLKGILDSGARGDVFSAAFGPGLSAESAVFGAY